VNKHEFVENLAEHTELSKADAGRALDAILESLSQAMSDGEEVRFTGFGTFSSQRRRAREGVNPQDPTQKIRIRAAHVPKFKAGASLRAAVSDGGPAAAEAPKGSPAARKATAAAPGETGDWLPLGRRS
jgi:DNA-binding protein HU-beta